jgi:hypothetical protein
VSDQTHIDTEGVARVANKVVQAGADFDAAFATLKSNLATHDGCWGDDKFGKNFATNYVDNAKKTLDGVGQEAKYVDEQAQVLVKTPREFQDLDTNSGQGVNS